MLLNKDEVLERIQDHSSSTPTEDMERILGISSLDEQVEFANQIAKDAMFSAGVILGLCIAVQMLEESMTEMPHDPFVNIP